MDLYTACGTGDLDTVRRLVQEGADVNSRDGVSESDLPISILKCVLMFSVAFSSSSL